MTAITTDIYGLVINSDNTYKAIADTLRDMPIVFAWTEQEGTHLDILMVYKPAQVGYLQRGMSAQTDLFVAVSHFGMFGFEINADPKYSGYVAEKLGTGVNVATDALTDLINGVMLELL